MTLRINEFDEVLGAEAVGIDLREPPSDREFQVLKDAFERRSVLVIRDQQDLDPASHIEFSQRFGPLEIHVQRKFLLEGHPEILIVSNVIGPNGPIGLVDAGHYWHSDLSYRPEPSLASLLHARVLPEEGGDTLFGGMHAAYDALPEATKDRIDRLDAVHSYEYRNAIQRARSTLRPGLDAAQAQSVPPVVHPVVRVHPATGRKALFVNEGFTSHIVGLEERASRALLDELCTHMVEPRFIYRHRWRAGDIVMWDNRAAIHFATGCPAHCARTLYRTTIRGDVPIRISSP